MRVIHTDNMIRLLAALKIKSTEYHLDNGFIELDLNLQQLMYTINASTETVQDLWGKTPEWKELTDLYKLIYEKPIDKHTDEDAQ